MHHEPFSFDQVNGVYWVSSWRKKFPTLLAGFTSREMQQHAISSWNLALHIQDDPLRVVENRRILAEIVDIPLESMTCAIQTHGKNIVEVTDQNRGSGAFEFATSIPDTDGLLTNQNDTLLILFFADCVPIYFYDPTKNAIGLAHAGWRGTVQNIVAEMVQKFHDIYGSKRDNILVAIGPSIGPCCYQVDQTVMNAVSDCLNGETQLVSTPDGEHHARLDLKKMNRILLERAGILSSNIEVSHLCTSCQNHRFFSHRKEQGRAGRMAAFAVCKGGEL